MARAQVLLPLAEVPTVKMINGEGFSSNSIVYLACIVCEYGGTVRLIATQNMVLLLRAAIRQGWCRLPHVGGGYELTESSV
ncbi:hypothetical protein ACSDBR_06750 [Acidithiobacillus ferriphilus]|uniref:hypothetical protein n=1 Tax=Acidithiobacillus ferriphilus TaxID=1689834 RepID=UPI003F517A25